MAYQLYGWILQNGERHVLKADSDHHPNVPPQNVIKTDTSGILLAECCCPGCCCDFDCAGGSTATPATLTATVTGDGDCDCLDGAYTLTKGLNCSWGVTQAVACNDIPDNHISIELTCENIDPPDNCPWSIGAGCYTPPVTASFGTINIQSCVPFIATATVVLTGGGSFCCDGTLTITITE